MDNSPIIRGRRDSVAVTGFSGMFNTGLPTSTGPVELTQIHTIYGAEKIAVGENHTLMIDRQRRLYGTGNNKYRQAASRPASMIQGFELSADAILWKDIACGTNHSLGLDKDGLLYAWGQGSYGQLGTGAAVGQIPVPTLIGPPHKVWKAVYAFDNASFAVDVDGNAHAWGQNMYGKLGVNSSAATIPTISPVKMPPCLEIAPGRNHTVFISIDGLLFSCGQNITGALGDAAFGTGNLLAPRLVNYPGTWRRVAAGENFSAGIWEDGTPRTWGMANYGQLGTGNTATQRNIVKPAVITDAECIDVGAGQSHVMFALADGGIFSAGLNQYGQLGTRDRLQKAVPVNIPSPRKFERLFVGFKTSFISYRREETGA